MKQDTLEGKAKTKNGVKHIRLLCDFDDKVAYIIGYVTYK